MARGRKKSDSQRGRRIAKALMDGKSQVQAVMDGGYSRSTAYARAGHIIQRPEVQTPLTEAFRKIGCDTEKVARVVFDALEANETVHTEVGTILTNHPDHNIRLKAYDRFTRAHGYDPREVEMPAPARPGLIVNIIKVETKAEPKAAHETIDVEPVKSNGHGGRLTVTISKRNGSR